MGETVVADAFESEVGVRSFVYGIHLPQSVVADGVFKPDRHPDLYIGNRITGVDTGISSYLAEEYIRLAHLRKDVGIPAEVTAVIDQVWRVHETHMAFEMEYDSENDSRGDYSLERVFRSTCADVRRKTPVKVRKAGFIAMEGGKKERRKDRDEKDRDEKDRDEKDRDEKDRDEKDRDEKKVDEKERDGKKYDKYGKSMGPHMKGIVDRTKE